MKDSVIDVRGKWAATLYRRLLVCLAPCLFAMLAGCGNTTTVTGKVTYKGRPVTYGSIIFTSSSTKARSAALQPDGSFTVEDVAPGPVKVAVISRDPSKGRASRHADKSLFKNWFALPKNLEDPERSGITATLGSGTVTYNLDL